MKRSKNILIHFVFFISCLILVVIIGFNTIPKSEYVVLKDTEETKKEVIEIIRLSAIGDSLTEGIGDTTGSGGYVPLLQKNLSNEYDVEVFAAENFGKSGDTSEQILKRLKNDSDMSASIETANVILLTAGGNDLMHALQPKLFKKITLETMEKPKESYYKDLEMLYSEIRQLNPTAPIYHLGIYNPFYLNFSDITELQDIIDFWNDSTLQFVSEQNNAYFVPINDDIYKGIQQPDGFEDFQNNNPFGFPNSEMGSLNALISSEDTFHPNNQGYQIIANAFEVKMASTKKEWLK